MRNKQILYRCETNQINIALMGLESDINIITKICTLCGDELNKNIL